MPVLSLDFSVLVTDNVIISVNAKLQRSENTKECFIMPVFEVNLETLFLVKTRQKNGQTKFN